MARRFFPAGICGLLLAAIIAASISTADSQLLVASSSFTADLYKPFFRKKATEKETLFVGRVLVLVLSLIAFVIVNSKGSGAQAIIAPVIEYISRCSFGIYIIHKPILVVLQKYFNHFTTASVHIQMPALFFASLFCSLILLYPFKSVWKKAGVLLFHIK